jgi:LytR cell envelope-related transcriptional attenuator
MEITDVVEQAGGIVALAAGLAFVLLLPLYFSQRRDIRRLVEFMENAPEHPAEDVAASEVLLDRAEGELEELVGVPEPEPAPPPRRSVTEALRRRRGPEAPEALPPPAEAAVPPVTAAAQRVTSERPALERITMERAALDPHPRWHHFVKRFTQPRWLVAIAAGAVVLAVVGIFGSELLLEPDGNERAPRAGALDPSQVSVAVLNGTTVSGLGAKVGDDVEANGFDLGAVTTIPEPFEDTVVMFEPGQERAARNVARDLGAGAVQPIDRQAQRLAEGADVVVVAGQDRASA